MMDDVVRERLRAIKSLIHLEDEAALETQLDKLADTDALQDERVQGIVEALRQGTYGEAIALIENVLAEDVQLTTTEAPEESEHRELRDVLPRLEAHLAELENEEADLQRKIRIFSARYRDELGPLVNKLLRFRKEQLEQSLYAKRSSRKRRAAYNEAEAQFERFQHVLEETDEEVTSSELLEDEQEHLKAIYRRASKLCHPDMVDESMEDEARTYFNELREAYQRNDLERVEAIAETLESSGFTRRPDDATSTDRARLEARAERLRRRIESVQEALDELRDSKAYEVIISVPDLDAYFDELKQELRHKIRQLKRGRNVRR